MLGRSVVAVTHGGMGVTQKALSSSVPVCVVPFGRDQLEVAARLREGAARVAAGFEAAGGATRAVDVVERLVRSRVG